jgi:molybdate transport repressor ModE-like protein
MIKDWDNIRIFLAIVRDGSLPAAAASLGINHTTVFRRVHELEETLETRLFQRSGRKLVLTSAGETLLLHAEAMETAVMGINRSVAGIDKTMEGPLVITTADTLAQTILPPILIKMAEAYPGLQLSVKSGNTMSNLNKRDADIAIRPTIKPPDDYVGRKLGPIEFSYFASEKLLHQLHISTLNLDTLRPRTALIAFDQSLKHIGAAQELEAESRHWTRVWRVDSLMTAQSLCAQGAGVALLPRFVNRLGILVELPERVNRPDFGSLWLLSHRDIMRAARVAEAYRFLFRELKTEFPSQLV